MLIVSRSICFYYVILLISSSPSLLMVQKRSCYTIIHALQNGATISTTRSATTAYRASSLFLSSREYCTTQQNQQCRTMKTSSSPRNFYHHHLHLHSTRSSTKIYSMATDPKTGGGRLSVSSADDDDADFVNDKGDNNEQHQHQLDLHETSHDDHHQQPDGSSSTSSSSLQSSSSSLSSDDDEVVSKPFTTSAYLAAVSPEAHKEYNRKKKKRNNNEAMKDVSFLRKRTANLLNATSFDKYSSQQQDGSDGSPSFSPQQTTVGRGKMKINLNTFNFLIDGWAFSNEKDSVDNAMSLLERMEELHYNYGSESPVCPDVRSYTKVINALSRSKRRDSGDLAERILDKMEEVTTSGKNTLAKPNTYTYTAAIEAHANSRNDDSPQRAEQLLERMVERYSNGDPDVLPNARCFNAAISSYAKSAVPGAALRAEVLLEKLDGLYMSGLEDAKPNRFNYNSLITAWANYRPDGYSDHDGDGNYDEFCSARKAEEILERMEQSYASGDQYCKPDIVSYNAVIDAYAKSSREDAAEHAEQILRRMGHLYKEGRVDIRPNTRSFNTVINAWAKSGRGDEAADKAQNLLDMMTRLYEEGNSDTVRPDVHTYCTVINAFARSPIRYKAERANNLFRSMKEAYEENENNNNNNNNRKKRHFLKPNVVAVNAVMNACAYTTPGDIQEQNRAMEIAHNRLKDLEDSDYGSPDHITYGTFLKVCANQMPDCSTRQQIMEVIFKKSIRDGQAGNLVLQQLKIMGPSELYTHLTGHSIEDNIRMESLPNEWWCNVVEGKWRRHRH